MRAYGAHSYEGINPDFLKWKRRFEKELAASFFPFFCEHLFDTGAYYCHLLKRYDVSQAEWDIVNGVAMECARVVEVKIARGGADEPWLWHLP